MSVVHNYVNHNSLIPRSKAAIFKCFGLGTCKLFRAPKSSYLCVFYLSTLTLLQIKTQKLSY